jgi:hypothetical protein
MVARELLNCNNYLFFGLFHESSRLPLLELTADVIQSALFFDGII